MFVCRASCFHLNSNKNCFCIFFISKFTSLISMFFRMAPFLGDRN